MFNFLENIFIAPFSRIVQTVILSAVYFFNVNKIIGRDTDYGFVVLFSAIVINLLIYIFYQRITYIVEVAKKSKRIINRLLSHLMIFIKLFFYFIVSQVIIGDKIFDGKPAFNLEGIFDDYAVEFLISDISAPLSIFTIVFIVISMITLVLYYLKSKKNHDNLFIHIIDNLDPLIYTIVFSILLYNSPAALSFFYIISALFSLSRVIINFYICKEKYTPIIYSPNDKKEIKNYTIYAVLLLLTWTVIIGAMIPSQVMSVSPVEFVTFGNNPIWIIFYMLSVFFIYALYAFLLYLILSKTEKKVFVIFMAIASVFSIANFMLFGNEFGIVTVMLKYEDKFANYNFIDILLNIGLIIFITAIIVLLSRFKKISKDVVILLFASVVLFSSFNTFNIYNKTKNIKAPVLTNEKDLKPIYTLSTNHKNVMVVMLDRFTGAHFSDIINQFPELKEKYDGFTYYPNTFSFGFQTTSGTPGLFGGYEYTPMESDRVTNKLVLEKHNEALTLMPRIFGENNYDVTYSDLPDVNYWDSSRPNPFKGLKNVKYKSMYGRIDFDSSDIYTNNIINGQKNNFVYYSFMRACPVILQSLLYNDGNYTYPDSYFNYTQSFINTFTLLKNYPRLTDAAKTERGRVIILDNICVHESAYLSYPNFDLLKPGDERISVDNIDNGVENELHTEVYDHYGTSVAAVREISKWLDHIKNIGAYDNTRIILVADHGHPYIKAKLIEGNVEPSKVSKYTSDEYVFSIYGYNPILLVKDFDKHGFNVSEEFMTNADTPYLATKGLIKNPINNITGRSISDSYKKNKSKLYFAGLTAPWQPTKHLDEYQFETVNRAFVEVNLKDIWDANNWTYIPDFVSPLCLPGMNHDVILIEKTQQEKCGINYLKDLYECKNCHKYFTDEYASDIIKDTTDYMIDIPHKFTDYKPDNNSDIENKIHGTMTAKCIYGCGEIDTKFDQNPMGYHEMDKVYIKPATIEEDGYETHQCTICDFESSERSNFVSKIEKIELEFTDYTYDGNDHNPSVYVYDREGNKLTDDDYSVHYHKSSVVGIADAEIIFKGRYGGTIQKYYVIHPNKLDKLDVQVTGDTLEIAYDGDTKKINGYEIEYSIDKNFDENFTTKVDIEKSKNKMARIRDIDDIYMTKEIYVRMRPYNLSYIEDENGVEQEIRIYGDWAYNFEE